MPKVKVPTSFGPGPTPPTTPILEVFRPVTPEVKDTLEEVSQNIENLVIPPPSVFAEPEEFKPSLPKTPKPNLESFRLKNAESLDFLADIVPPPPEPFLRPQSMVLTSKQVKFSDGAETVYFKQLKVNFR